MRISRSSIRTLIVALIGTVALAGVTAMRSNAMIILFDDLSDQNVPIPNGYAGLDWSNFSSISASYDPYGAFPVAAVSQPNIAYGYNASQEQVITSSSPFAFNSGYFTSIFTDGDLIATGYVGSTPTYSKTFAINDVGPTLVNFDWSGIDELTFDDSDSFNWGVDNLDVTESVVPEPGTSLVFMPGSLAIVGMLVSVRRKRPIASD